MFDELLEKLQKLEGVYSIWDIEDEAFNEILDEDNCIEDDIDVDKRRWYHVSTTVYEIDGRFLGVRGVTELKSENMGVDDTGVELEFFEMKEVTSVTYEKM